MTLKPVLGVAKASDASAVERALLASYPTLMVNFYDDALLAEVLPMMTRANPKLLASGTYYLAEVDGEPVGCGGCTREEPGTGNVLQALAQIRHFGLAAGWVGHGIGRALHAHSEANAKKEGVKQFECFASLNGEVFYKAFGFSAIGTIRVHMGPTIEFPSILMRRTI